jgi:hypothetical protein
VQFLHRDTIHAHQFQRDRAEDIGLALNAGLALDQFGESLPLASGNVEQEHIRHAWRRAGADGAHQRPFQQVGRKRKHHPDTKRHQHGRRMISGTVEIGRSVPHRGR